MKKLFFTLLCLTCLVSLQAQVFYGTTANGGTNDVGVIFSFNAKTGAYTKLKDFTRTDGQFPGSSLMQASNGKFYGVTVYGGNAGFPGFGYGLIYSFDPTTNVYSVAQEFNGSNGAYPRNNGIIQAKDGKIYGMTFNGGGYGLGNIYSFDPVTNKIAGLKALNVADGYYPNGSFVQANDGKLYGMTTYGGTNDVGVIFSFNPATGAYKKLKDFSDADGKHPNGSLIQASNGKLYGVTFGGGAYSQGVVFSFDPVSGNYNKLKDFGGSDGALPLSKLTQAKDGKLYGLTHGGGNNSAGVIFSYDPVTSQFAKLKDLGGDEGGNSASSLVEASDGKLYGLVKGTSGNSYDVIIFSLDPVTGNYKKLKEVNGADGAGIGYASLTELTCNTMTYYRDADDDGYGDRANKIFACSVTIPSGYVKDSSDCDDKKANVYPGAAEVCGNGIDDNCNGQVDEECAVAITAFTLVNTSTGKDIQELRNGEVLDLAKLSGARLNIRANTNPSTVGSVVFSLKGPHSHIQTENLLPYALFGDDMKSSYYGSLLPVGEYSLTATPYGGNKGSGEKGTSLTIQFKVIYSATVNSYTLVNADTDKDILQLKDGEVLNLATLPSIKLNIRANTSPGVVGSVVFDLSGAQVRKHTENSAPYALFMNNKSDYYAWAPQVGSYTLTATPKSGTGGGGENGSAKTILFKVVYQPVQSFTLVDASNGTDIRELKQGDVINLSMLPGVQLNIRANTGSAKVGSVLFELQGPTTHKQTENLLPYALFGDDMKGKYYGWTPGVGSYQLTASAFTKQKGSGIKGQGYTLGFEVVDKVQSTCPEPSFAPPVTTANGFHFNAAAADFNNDGKPDLAFRNDEVNGITIYIGNGDGSFTKGKTYLPEIDIVFNIATGDFDKDGNVDLAIGNDDNGGRDLITVLRGEGDGSFGKLVSYATGGFFPYRVITADFNKDGKQDLAVANTGSKNIGLLLGKGDGSFAKAKTFAVTGEVEALVSADFNGDGNLDLAVTDALSGYIGVLLGDGLGSFGQMVKYAAGSSQTYRMAAADFNNDGKQDLAVTLYANRISILLSKESGGFENPIIYSSGGNFSNSIITVDLNDDGNQDLVVENKEEPSVGVFMGRGDGSFAEVVMVSENLTSEWLAADDFNGDGKPDIAFGFGGTNVLLNTCGSTMLQTLTKGADKSLTVMNDKAVINLTASPNPFTSQSTVRFSVPTTYQAVLGMYNMSGVEVARLFQGNADGGKEYRVLLEGKGMPAGIYILRLTTGQNVQSHKVVLIR